MNELLCELLGFILLIMLVAVAMLGVMWLGFGFVYSYGLFVLIVDDMHLKEKKGIRSLFKRKEVKDGKEPDSNGNISTNKKLASND